MGKFILFANVGFFVCAGFVGAQMTSTNYEIRWDTVSTGGSDTSSSASYQIHGTTEAVVGGTSTSTSYQVDQGYRSAVYDKVIDFSIYIQDLTDERLATVFSGTTITTTTSGISVGDFIVLIQDKGPDQVAGIGQVSAVTATTITVDVLKNGGTAPVVDGDSDFVYQLDQTALSFGTMDISNIAQALIAWEVSIDNDNGYVVQVVEDGNFRSGSQVITDVSDGTVSVGSNEYGARSSDTSIANSTFDTADTSITSSFQDVANESSASFESRNFLTFKAAPSSSNSTGSYAHTISLIASGNF